LGETAPFFPRPRRFSGWGASRATQSAYCTSAIAPEEPWLNVPENIFAEQVESDDPPTITQLAEQGKKSRKPIYDIGDKDPADYAITTQVCGSVREFRKFCDSAD
jgi:hypothetical protein